MGVKFPLSTPVAMQLAEDFFGYGLSLESDQIALDYVYDLKGAKGLFYPSREQFEVETTQAAVADCQYLIGVMALQAERLAPLEGRQLAKQQYPELATMF
jgi:hypothetical protein